MWREHIWPQSETEALHGGIESESHWGDLMKFTISNNLRRASWCADSRHLRASATLWMMQCKRFTWEAISSTQAFWPFPSALHGATTSSAHKYSSFPLSPSLLYVVVKLVENVSPCSCSLNQQTQVSELWFLYWQKLKIQPMNTLLKVI